MFKFKMRIENSGDIKTISDSLNNIRISIDMAVLNLNYIKLNLRQIYMIHHNASQFALTSLINCFLKTLKIIKNIEYR